MQTENKKHERLLERIRAGEIIEGPEEMSEEYRTHLVNLMQMQADSELSGGFGYVPWIVKGPTVPEMLAVATIVKDEVRHARVMYRLLADLGINPEEKIRQTDLTLRVSGDQDLGTARAAGDKRVNIFGRPNSPRNKIYRELRLKIRENDEVRRAFAAEVKEIAEPLGLSLP
ncbi:MAG: phenylacetate-CoA oxygenase subunit PaaI, partial [candidate division NC10 bacterium]|nr:phenylacetate-CoA oxygenase subunit PaaI [candidate division NC10 bacterium]